MKPFGKILIRSQAFSVFQKRIFSKYTIDFSIFFAIKAFFLQIVVKKLINDFSKFLA